MNDSVNPPEAEGRIDAIYRERFTDHAIASKFEVWRPIVDYLQRYVDRAAPILDVACDRGYFIAQVDARERWGSDVRDMAPCLPTDVRFVRSDALDLGLVAPNSYFGTIFVSNFLEHLASPDDVVRFMRVAWNLLTRGGRLIVLQPNVRLVGGRYWDFIDHRTPLTDRSLREAAALAGFAERVVVVRFLPYSTVGRLPSHPRLVRTYLRLPPLWRIFGKQTLYVGERP